VIARRAVVALALVASFGGCAQTFDATTLGVPATLESLVRERSGDFGIEESLPWPQVLASSRESLLARSHPLS